ncbi:vanadium-dependent haloperoxidase [Piscinibacter sakaiensis]|uniref:vanadium-dependent haloperoxidase n=1 Tax=Piscinibacter sakaiensis TaxID=1547922 RepID=UPI003AABAD86
MYQIPKPWIPMAIAAWAALQAAHADADVVIDWNQRASEVISEAKIGTPVAIRVMALVQTAVRDAVDATAGAKGGGKATVVDAAVAAASGRTLGTLLPARQAQIDALVQNALSAIGDSAARDAGVAAGERAATALLARRAADDPAAAVAWRPHTSAGAYVPTAMPAIPQWSLRKPWLMNDAAQFRPGAPPALDSTLWLREYEEVRLLGSKTSRQRTAEQTAAAEFWAFSLPSIYYGVVRSVAAQPGRDLRRNARLYAAASQAMDDAMISAFEAKYHYNFWRPVTAIRNGDLDGHAETQRDAGWVSLIEAPLHPEYPSGHSILAASVAAVLKADIGGGRTPTLSTSSPSAQGAVRRWGRVDDFVQEVSDARIWAGIHFRAATRAGEAMGRRIGELAAQRLLVEGSH